MNISVDSFGCMSEMKMKVNKGKKKKKWPFLISAVAQPRQVTIYVISISSASCALLPFSSHLIRIGLLC